MASKKLVRVIQGGKHVREYRVSAILGRFFERLEKDHGRIEVSDPDLETKLTAEELKSLYAKFPELDPNRILPPEPKPVAIEFRKHVEPEPVGEVESEAVEAEEDRLRSLLDAAGVKHGRVKHLTKLQEMVNELDKA